MSIRHLIVAGLAASACAAHADVIPSSAAAPQSGFLSGWTTGNGTNVIGSGVLPGNLTLIGGIAYNAASKASGDTSSASLADVLYGKASASIGQGADGQTKLFYKQGIEGMYLLGAGHGILAAMLGNGVSVVGSSDGVVVTPGSTSGPGAPASLGGFSGGSSGGVGGGSGGGSAGGSTGGAAGGSTGSYAGGTIGIGGSTGGATGGGSTGGTIGGSAGGSVSTPSPTPVPPIGAVVLPQPTPAAEVPEPSSIALMLAGMLGAGALLRRRSS